MAAILDPSNSHSTTFLAITGDLSAALILQLVAGLVLTVAVVPVTIQIRNDYLSFLALGPGGTAQTFPGYLRVKVLGLFALRNRYTARSLPASSKGCLNGLPKRLRKRPETRGIAPQRQVNQRISPAIYDKLAAGIENMAPGDNNDLIIGTSCFEKHGTGLFSVSPAKKTCGGEIVHLHRTDGSMHATFHPADANVILERGWGERHPLAGVFFRKFLPEDFLMLYAPQNEEEIELVLRMVRAAKWYINGDGARCIAGKQMQGDEGREVGIERKM